MRPLQISRYRMVPTPFISSDVAGKKSDRDQKKTELAVSQQAFVGSAADNYAAFSNLVDVFTHLIETKPEKKDEYTNELLKNTNSKKALEGYLNGLRDPLLMQKKKDFEYKFRACSYSLN